MYVYLNFLIAVEFVMNLVEKCRMLCWLIKNRTLSELKRQKEERHQRNELKEKAGEKEKNSIDIKIKLDNIEKQTSPEVDPVVPTSGPPDGYELEEGIRSY